VASAEAAAHSLFFDQGSGAGMGRAKTPENVVVPNAWNLVAITRQGAGTDPQSIRFYVNGVQVAADGASYAPQGCAGSTFISGDVTAAQPDGPFLGDLDEVQLYDRVLSEAEIKAMAEQAVPPDYDLTAGLRAFYRLDGNADDASGHGLAGEANNVAWTTDLADEPNRACVLNGHESRIELHNSDALDLIGDLTLSGWVWVASPSRAPAPYYQKIITRESARRGAYRFGVSLSAGSGQPRQALFLDQGTGLDRVSTGPDVLVPNAWNFVAVTRTGSGTTASSVNFYVNGRWVGGGQFSQPPVSVAANTALGEAAWDEGPVSAPLDGKLDEVRIYDRVLAEAELRQLCGLDQRLLALYRFTGQVLDESGHAQHGLAFQTKFAPDFVGEPGQAGEFDGLTSRIELQNSGLLDVTGSLTLAAWLWAATPSQSPTPYYQKMITRELPGGGAYRFGFSLEAGPGRERLALFLDQGTGLESVITGPEVILPNAWNYVAVTRSGPGTAPDSVKFFVNGRLVASRSFTQPPRSVAANTFIGELNLSGGAVMAPLHGRLDEVRVYGRALAAEELRQLYLADCGTARLVGVSLVEGNEVQVNFEAPALPSARFALESTEALGGVAPWVQEPSDRILRTAMGQFEARVPVRGSAGFYRVLIAP
jgi:hypothetical protein